ncbi:MAG: hypothetical protein ABIT68_09770 [Sphingomicrobium sp.]
MLEGRVSPADRFERSADRGDARRGQAELLQFGGCGLIADIQCSRDQRRLRQLGVLDPRQRASASATSAGRCRGKRCFVDLLPRENGLDHRLALLDFLGAGFGCVAQRKRLRAGRDHFRGGEAGPCDQRHHNDKEKGLDGSGKAETTQLGAVMNEQVAIPEERECGHRGQNLRHIVVAPNPQRARQSAFVCPPIRGAPQPHCHRTDCPPVLANLNLTRPG